MHYAGLVVGKVDAFIIGSEMIGLTGFSDYSGSYPAVGQFMRLASLAKARLRNSALVTYAADWSEYHYSKESWISK